MTTPLPQNTAEARPRSAPSYDILSEQVVSIEHPCVIKNVENGLKSLGGEAHVQQLFDIAAEGINETSQPSPSIGVSLRPNDPFAKRIASVHVPTRNVLFRVTVPRRTGRKRKRGTDGPFVESTGPDAASGTTSAFDILGHLRDNPDNYEVEAVGTIADTHRFHHLPDMQMRAAELPIMREVRDHAITVPDYDTLKQFHIDLRPGSEGINAFPAPPSFLPPVPPFQYGYQQHLEPLRSKIRPQRMPLDGNEAVPQAVPAHLPSTYIRGVEKALPPLRRLLDRRPIITLYVASREVPQVPKHHLEIALLYLAYHVDAGPWRGAYVKFGVDPRADPEFRTSQTIHIDAPAPDTKTKGARRAARKGGEFFGFDGETVANPLQGVYQLQDLSAPLLRDLVEAAEVRAECHVRRWGWLPDVTVAKLHVLTRDMVKSVLEGVKVPRSEHSFVAGLQSINDSSIYGQMLEGMDRRYIQKLIEDMAALIHDEPEPAPQPSAEDGIAAGEVSSDEDGEGEEQSVNGRGGVGGEEDDDDDEIRYGRDHSYRVDGADDEDEDY